MVVHTTDASIGLIHARTVSQGISPDSPITPARRKKMPFGANSMPLLHAVSRRLGESRREQAWIAGFRVIACFR